MVVNPHKQQFIDDYTSQPQESNQVKAEEKAPAPSEIIKKGTQYNTDKTFLSNFQKPQAKPANEKAIKNKIISKILKSMK